MSRSKTLLTLCLIVALGGVIHAQKLPPWELANIGQPGQHTTWLAKAGGGTLGLPVELGDYNGDGFVDWAVAAITADTGPGNVRNEGGEVYVFAGDGTIGGTINLANAPAGQPLLTVMGAASGDYLGTEMYSADITGDGFTDLIIGAFGTDRAGANNVGAVHVIRGGPGFGGIIDLASPPANIITFLGQSATDRLGVWVEAGDINGDGTDDLLMSADDGNGITGAEIDRGEAHIVYGGQVFPSLIDMLNPPPTLQFVTIYGEDDGDQFGSTLHAVDLDNDGFEELIASAALQRAIGSTTGTGIAGGNGPNNTKNDAGDTYIIWGGPSLPAVIDLDADQPAMLGAGSLSVIYGADQGDALGEEITSGNFDSDAFADLCLGALVADGFNNANNLAGDAVVVYGGPQLRGQVLDTFFTPAGTTTIYGGASGDITADTLSACDVNNDGIDDLLVAIPNFNNPNNGNADAGGVLVYYGGTVRWPTVLRMSMADGNTDIPTRRVFGVDQGDLTGYSQECGDVDDDGFGDIFPDSMRGDGFLNSASNAGEVNIVSGRLFSEGIITVVTEPKINTLVTMDLTGEPGFIYGMAFSGGIGPAIPVPGGGQIHLANDFFFQISVTPPLLPNFVATSGTLNSSGKGLYGLIVPNIPSVVGSRIYTAGVTVHPTLFTVSTITATTSFVLQN